MPIVNATLTIRLVYDTTELEDDDKPLLVKNHLLSMVDMLACDGALSGYHNMTVDEWDCEVSAIEINKA